jgi:hypothetical protein
MSELSQKESTAEAFDQMQEGYLKDLNHKFGQAKQALDNMLNDSLTNVNGIMMTLGIGLS